MREIQLKGESTMSNEKLRTFENATAIITGGASGIGRAMAEELARRGGEVVLADRQIELAQEVAAGIRAAGGKAEAAELDVTDFPALESLLQGTVERTGRLDYVFNNAGIVILGAVSLYGVQDWNQIVDVNLRGVTNGVQAAYPIMLRQGFGHIVNTASMAGLVPSPANVGYAATKHAVVGLSTSLRTEAAPLGIRVSVLCPGFIRTPIVQGGGKYGKVLGELSPEQQRYMSDSIEKLRLMPPDVFAKKALNAVAKNKAIIVLPSWWKLFWWNWRLSPSLSMFFAQRTFKDALEKLYPMQRSQVS
jgi:NAD(P)-dependent dehydrogenase (short-subunit alcohol dehydrogenase family)